MREALIVIYFATRLGECAHPLESRNVRVNVSICHDAMTATLTGKV